jgi:DNA-binding transcriptional MerR regulator/methylmalonyl-CoA mutase cobalamin-binding subunit
MESKGIYTIKYVSKRTGLTPHAIRAWERRYGAVAPQRSANNRRLYSEDDVYRLQLLKAITDSGHNISQVAKLNSAELDALAQRDVSLLPQPGNGRQKPSHVASGVYYYQKCLSAVLDLNADKLEKTYDRAAIDLTRTALLRDVIVPLFREIGKLWHSGSLKIVNEHMATTVTRIFLLNMLRTTEIPDSAPRIVVATTLGQWHDVGALTVALTAAENGWDPIYFGPNLPAEEIATTVKQSNARAVAISITHTLNQHALINELRKLKRYVGPKVTLFVGGRALGDNRALLSKTDVRFIEDFEDFSNELHSLLVADEA